MCIDRGKGQGQPLSSEEEGPGLRGPWGKSLVPEHKVVKTLKHTKHVIDLQTQKL